jgi:hypothetical protein
VSEKPTAKNVRRWANDVAEKLAQNGVTPAHILISKVVEPFVRSEAIIEAIDDFDSWDQALVVDDDDRVWLINP